jgi:hypothetical protein
MGLLSMMDCLKQMFIEIGELDQLLTIKEIAVFLAM